MGKVTCIYLVVAGMLCFLQGQIFEIKKEIINGNLMFTWTNISTRRNYVTIAKDGYISGWIQITNNKYIVKDAWRYQSVAIRVREYKTADFTSYEDYTTTFYAQTFLIRKQFINGQLKFTWTDFSKSRYDIQIVTDGRRSGWIQTTDDKYTVEDVWKYKSVIIIIREYTNAGYTVHNSTYTMSQIDAQEGESKNLTWTADFFPRAGLYNIYHFDDDKSDIIMQVMMTNAIAGKPFKYVYHTKPYNSTNIILEVKNITLMDAGYYAGGGLETIARSGPGVILVVRENPTKFDITGPVNVSEHSEVTLICSFNSTSRPSYYSKPASFNYTWFINDTVLTSESRKTLRIQRITRDERFNKYSCQTRETIQSNKSDDIQINVWYDASSVTVNPPLPVNQILSVKDGDYIGPYHCSADCNPPCSIQWKYKFSNGTIGDAESDGGTLQKQRVFRDQVLFRCRAISTLDLNTSLNLDMILSFGPNLSKNIETTTIVVAIVSTLLALTMAIIIVMALRYRSNRRLDNKQSQPENESNVPMNAAEERRQPEGTSGFPLNDYEKMNATTDGHFYDKVEAE